MMVAEEIEEWEGRQTDELPTSQKCTAKCERYWISGSRQQVAKPLLTYMYLQWPSHYIADRATG